MTKLERIGTMLRSGSALVLLLGSACQRSGDPAPEPVTPVTSEPGSAPGATATTPAATPPATIAAPTSTAAPPGTVAAQGNPDPGENAADDRCSRDEDCVVPPRRGCCGECPQSPPFKAVTRATDEAARKNTEDACSVKKVDCGRWKCDALPRGCSAAAFCESGRCQARASAGCTH